MELLLLICGVLEFIACQEKVIVGYFVPWGKVPADKLSYDKVTHINYGFGLLKNKQDPAEISFDKDYDGNALKSLLKARPKNVKVLISLGGWTGSQTFSKLVADEKHRQKFIENAMVYLKQGSGEPGPDGWGLDGLDIDWEYPGRDGAACNDPVSNFKAVDTDNYALLLSELRKRMDGDFGKGKKLLTAAVHVNPFEKDGVPLKNVQTQTQHFDFVNIMAYDLNGVWDSATGANAPFSAEEGKVSYKKGIDDWVRATGSPDKVVAGLAFYGRTQITKEDMDGSKISVPNDGTHPQGDDMDSNKANPNCDEGTNYSGVYRYRKLREKILTDKTTAGAGYTRYFDKASQTPYLFNKAEKKFISYDDVESLKIKVDHAKAMNLRGVMYWDMTQDHNDELLDVLQPFNGGSSSQPSTKGNTKNPTTEPPSKAPSTNEKGPVAAPEAQYNPPTSQSPTNSKVAPEEASPTTQKGPAAAPEAPGLQYNPPTSQSPTNSKVAPEEVPQSPSSRNTSPG
ncbi:hypothetical protein DSO57_1006209, partial [Entomophthora muscae]